MRRKKNGFTLVELLAVIVVLSLIMIIAIPTVLNISNNARREAFYLYAQSIYSKAVARYTQDMDDPTILEDCLIYDISTDLGLKNTGDYEGWVKVNRSAVVDETKKTALINLTSTTEMKYVRYCIGNGACTPSLSYNINDGTKSVQLTQVIREGQQFCAFYQYISGNQLTTSPTQCVNFNNATASIQDYKYDVELTMKSREYAVASFSLNEETSQDLFDEAIDTFAQKAAEDRAKKDALAGAIPSPVCKIDDEVTYKGVTTVKNATITTSSQTNSANNSCPQLEESRKNFNIILNPNGGTLPSGSNSMINQCAECYNSVDIPTPTRSGYIFDGWYYDKSFSKKLIGNQSSRVDKDIRRTATGCIEGYNSVNLYAKWRLDESQTTTSSQITYVGTTEGTTEHSTYVGSTEATTEPSTYVGSTETTKDIITSIATTLPTTGAGDATLLLDSLSVSGQDIGFSPIKFDYEIKVPYNQQSVNVTPVLHSPSTTDMHIEGTPENLSVGHNRILVFLTNKENAKTNYYRLTVVRLNEAGEVITTPNVTTRSDWDPSSGMPDPSIDESNAALSLLQISGYSIEFNPNLYEYDLKVNNLSKLGITYKTAGAGAYVSITGNDNLKDGSVVELTCVSKNGFYVKRYRITIRYTKPASTSAKILRGVAIALGVILVAALIISFAGKGKRGKKNKAASVTPNNNVVNPTPIANTPQSSGNIAPSENVANNIPTPQAPSVTPSPNAVNQPSVVPNPGIPTPQLPQNQGQPMNTAAQAAPVTPDINPEMGANVQPTNTNIPQ